MKIKELIAVLETCDPEALAWCDLWLDEHQPMSSLAVSSVEIDARNQPVLQIGVVVA